MGHLGGSGLTVCAVTAQAHLPPPNPQSRDRPELENAPRAVMADEGRKSVRRERNPTFLKVH